MKKVYFTITGTRFFLGQDFFRPGMRVRLVKDHDNKFDREAIKVRVGGLGDVGYVANSPCTVIGESMSAGRLYDKIGENVRGRVLYVTDKGIICSVSHKDLRFWNDPEIALDEDYRPGREWKDRNDYDGGDVDDEDDDNDNDDMPF